MISEAQILRWINRNGWNGSEQEAKNAIEDARSLHLDFLPEEFVDPLGTEEDYRNDVIEAQKTHDENPSSKTSYDLYSAKEVYRRRFKEWL